MLTLYMVNLEVTYNFLNDKKTLTYCGKVLLSICVIRVILIQFGIPLGILAYLLEFWHTYFNPNNHHLHHYRITLVDIDYRYY